MAVRISSKEHARRDRLLTGGRAAPEPPPTVTVPFAGAETRKDESVLRSGVHSASDEERTGWLGVRVQGRKGRVRRRVKAVVGCSASRQTSLREAGVVAEDSDPGGDACVGKRKTSPVRDVVLEQTGRL